MSDIADVLEGLDGPAALFTEEGRMAAANSRFMALGETFAALAWLEPGERRETAWKDGATLVWRSRTVRGGRRLVVGEAGAVASPASRERYLAALSHELRTPLNGVLGMAGLLGRTRLDADQKSYVAALKDSGEHLLSLVNDVLDLAKLESGAVDLEPHPVDLERLLQGVAELLSPRAHEKGLEIAWAAPHALPPVMADDGRLRQILFNLAGNAVKFTEAGGVMLSVCDLGEGRLRFEVCDTGKGVPPADQARIFEEFARSGPHERLEGAGLGLAIVRRLAQAHDGAVGLTNRPEGGATFWFEAVFEPAGPEAADQSLAGRVVAVVSHNPVVRKAAAAQVGACGGEALVYDSLKAAEAAPEAAVLLVDHALKAPSRGLRPPAGRQAIVLLAPEERARIPRCRKAGFDGYLIKPLRRASLAERVLAVIHRQDEIAVAVPVEDDRIAAEAVTGAKVLLAEDNPINALLARTLLERLGCTVHRAAHGGEAVDACNTGRYDIILMDLRMPVMDGLQATAALRAGGVRTPIVALTADAFEEDRRACLAAGMDDFLTKPLDSAALRAALTKWAGFTAARAEAKLAS